MFEYDRTPKQSGVIQVSRYPHADTLACQDGMTQESRPAQKSACKNQANHLESGRSLARRPLKWPQSPRIMGTIFFRGSPGKIVRSETVENFTKAAHSPIFKMLHSEPFQIPGPRDVVRTINSGCKITKKATRRWLESDQSSGDLVDLMGESTPAMVADHHQQTQHTQEHAGGFRNRNSGHAEV